MPWNVKRAIIDEPASHHMQLLQLGVGLPMATEAETVHTLPPARFFCSLTAASILKTFLFPPLQEILSHMDERKSSLGMTRRLYVHLPTRCSTQ